MSTNFSLQSLTDFGASVAYTRPTFQKLDGVACLEYLDEHIFREGSLSPTNLQHFFFYELLTESVSLQLFPDDDRATFLGLLFHLQADCASPTEKKKSPIFNINATVVHALDRAVLLSKLPKLNDPEFDNAEIERKRKAEIAAERAKQKEAQKEMSIFDKGLTQLKYFGQDMAKKVSERSDQVHAFAKLLRQACKVLQNNVGRLEFVVVDDGDGRGIMRRPSLTDVFSNNKNDVILTPNSRIRLLDAFKEDAKKIRENTVKKFFKTFSSLRSRDLVEDVLRRLSSSEQDFEEKRSQLARQFVARYPDYLRSLVSDSHQGDAIVGMGRRAMHLGTENQKSAAMVAGFLQASCLFPAVAPPGGVPPPPRRGGGGGPVPIGLWSRRWPVDLSLTSLPFAKDSACEKATFLEDGEFVGIGSMPLRHVVDKHIELDFSDGGMTDPEGPTSEEGSEESDRAATSGSAAPASKKSIVGAQHIMRTFRTLESQPRYSQSSVARKTLTRLSNDIGDFHASLVPADGSVTSDDAVGTAHCLSWIMESGAFDPAVIQSVRIKNAPELKMACQKLMDKGDRDVAECRAEIESIVHHGNPAVLGAAWLTSSGEDPDASDDVYGGGVSLGPRPPPLSKSTTSAGGQSDAETGTPPVVDRELVVRVLRGSRHLPTLTYSDCVALYLSKNCKKTLRDAFGIAPAQVDRLVDTLIPLSLLLTVRKSQLFRVVGAISSYENWAGSGRYRKEDAIRIHTEFLSCWFFFLSSTRCCLLVHVML